MNFNYEDFQNGIQKDSQPLVTKNWKENCKNMAGGNGGDCTHYFVSPSEDYIIFQDIINYFELYGPTSIFSSRRENGRSEMGRVIFGPLTLSSSISFSVHYDLTTLYFCPLFTNERSLSVQPLIRRLICGDDF